MQAYQRTFRRCSINIAAQCWINNVPATNGSRYQVAATKGSRHPRGGVNADHQRRSSMLLGGAKVPAHQQSLSMMVESAFAQELL
jgi:hypothetical protein